MTQTGEQEKQKINPEEGDFTPALRDKEREDVERRTAPPASVIHEAIRAEGEDELRRPSSALAWSGLAAGLSMGFSMVGEGLIRARLPDQSWRPLLTSLGYTVGYLVVVLGRQQLFTENTLTPILPLLARRDLATLRQVLRLWGIVLIANLIGAYVFAWVVGHSAIFEPDVQQAFADFSAQALSSDFLTMLLKGVFAGWLIALMVWLLPFAETARISVIILITYIVGLSGFAHIIVGSIEIFFGVTTGVVSLGDYVAKFMIPTLIGNCIGGVSLVAALGHAQVIAGSGEDA